MKCRLHISFDMPGRPDPKKIAQAVSKIINTTRKMVGGEVEFSLPDTKVELNRITVVVQSEKAPPRADQLKLRLPELQNLEILDGSVN